MKLFDTHTHVQFPQFNADREATLERAHEAGLTGMLVIGTDAKTSDAAVDLAQQHDWLYAAVGVHPHDAEAMTADDFAYISKLARLEFVVAVGEIGLDFYRELSPRVCQEEVLQRQLELALECGKPVIVHSRDAEEALYPVLQPYAERAIRRPGVMHAFGGNLKQAMRYVELGFLVSLPCTVTYPKNDRALELARELPLRSIVVETDSPYLPPQKRRGKRNEPAYVEEAVRRIAEVRGIEPAAVAATTEANARRLFGLETEAW
jgi:TatD DNase family protein